MLLYCLIQRRIGWKPAFIASTGGPVRTAPGPGDVFCSSVDNQRVQPLGRFRTDHDEMSCGNPAVASRESLLTLS